jgi:hypothetical protein
LVSSGGTTPNISLPNVIIQTGSPFTTAIGAGALSSNTATGSSNTATGFEALFANTTGAGNTAIGRGALSDNTAGFYNTASGVDALGSNTTGTFNTASGWAALFHNTTGDSNTAIGWAALGGNITGRNNIAVGKEAGALLTTGSENIYVGTSGVEAEFGTIRIGNNNPSFAPPHQRVFIAGISGVMTAGVGEPVFVSAAGQLGTVSSSRRFKEEIQDMGEASRGLMRLRPVSFRYKKGDAAEARPLEYGLIAEEVAEVYPELVGYAATGEVQSVQYHKVNVLLLHEVQQQHRKIEEQSEEVKALKARLETLERLLGAVAQR